MSWSRGIDGSEAKGASLIGADGLWSTLRAAHRSRGKPALHRRDRLARAAAARRPCRPLRRARGRALARAARASRALPGPRRARAQCRRRHRRRRRAARLEPAGERRNFARRLHPLVQGFEIVAGTRGGLAQLVALSPRPACAASAKAASPFSATPRIPCCPISRKARRLPSRMPSRWPRRSPRRPATRRQAFRRYAELRRPRAVPRPAPLAPLRPASIISAERLRLARNLVLERRSGEAALADLDWLYARRAPKLNGYGLSFSASSRCCLIAGRVFAANCFNACVVAALGIFVEQLRGLAVRLDLLLDVELVELLGLRLGQRVEHASVCFLSSSVGSFTSSFSAWTMPFSSSVVLLCASTICAPNCLDRLRLSLLAGDLARGHLVQVARRRPS